MLGTCCSIFFPFIKCDNGKLKKRNYTKCYYLKLRHRNGAWFDTRRGEGSTVTSMHSHWWGIARVVSLFNCHPSYVLVLPHYPAEWQIFHKKNLSCCLIVWTWKVNDGQGKNNRKEYKRMMDWHCWNWYFTVQHKRQLAKLIPTCVLKLRKHSLSVFLKADVFETHKLWRHRKYVSKVSP